LTLIGIKPYNKQKYKNEQEKVSAIRRMNGFGKLNKSNYDQMVDNKLRSFYGNFGEESDVLQEYIEQQTRLGSFEPIFPLEYNVNYYSQFFERERPNNELLRSYVSK